MMCASSRITRCQETLNSAPTVPSRSPTLNSPHTTPYVVTTTSCARSVASSRRDRAAPWYTTERRFDFSSSSSFHCCMTIAGHTIPSRSGGGADTITAIIDTVFPSPWSSARIPPRHLVRLFLHRPRQRPPLVLHERHLEAPLGHVPLLRRLRVPQAVEDVRDVLRVHLGGGGAVVARVTDRRCVRPSTGGGSSASPPAAAALGAASARFARSASRRARQVWSRSDARQ